MEKIISSWSGGKDSCFACYKAIQQGHHVLHLLNITTDRATGHKLSFNLLSDQAKVIKIPLIYKNIKWNEYEDTFKKIIINLKEVKAVVFGDIYLQEHKDWIERICKELKIVPLLPLWGIDTIEIIKDFIACGFETIIVSTNSDFLGNEFLGRQIDLNLIQELLKLKIDPCGENGEFHTFVVGGPLFKKRIKIKRADKILKNKHWILDILEYEM